MFSNLRPAAVVDKLLDAGNCGDIDAYCALFSPNATISTLNRSVPVLYGAAAIRGHYSKRFKKADLKCEIVSRIELGNFVIDHERVTGLNAEPVDIIAILEVQSASIQSVRFIWP